MFLADHSGAPGYAVPLTALDRDLLELAVLHGVKGTERPIAVFFSFGFNRPGARAAVAELRTLGWPSAGMTEEWAGCDFWHVYAYERRGHLSDAGIAELRVEMEALAKRCGGTLDVWEVGSGGDLRYARPGEVSE